MSETKITMSADVQTMINLFYPVGIIVQFSNDTNPNNLYPWQTWEQDTSGMQPYETVARWIRTA